MTAQAAAQTDPAARTASTAAVWTALVTVYLVWGSTYLGIRVVVETMPPLVAMGVRFIAAAGLLGAMLAARHGVRALKVSRRQAGAAGVLGVLLLVCGNGGVAVAEQTVPSGLAALLVSAMPLWLVAIRALARDRPRPVSLAGTLLGFVGIALLTLPGSRSASVELWGMLLIVAGTLGWATGSFISPKLPLPANPFVTAVWEMLLGGTAMVVIGSARGELRGFSVGQVSADGWVALAYLTVIGSVVAFSAFAWLLANAPVSLISTYAYVNPVVAVLLGFLILDEPVTGLILVGGAIVVLGVALVVSAERSPAQEPARQSTAARRNASLAAGSETVTRTPSRP
jgi:drug/metabolite transporter (DMT)-like permease